MAELRDRFAPRAPGSGAVLLTGAQLAVLVKDAADLSDSTPVDAEHIYQQLLANYEPKGIEWVRGLKWVGPVNVPLDDIDWDSEKTWAAHHQKRRVKRFAARIRSGDQDVKPVIMVRVPGNQKNVIIDGHHRSLGYRKEDEPVKAYVGNAPSANPDDPWFQAHLYQVHQGSDPANKSMAIGHVGAEDDTLAAVSEKSLDVIEKRFNPAELRDAHGRWTSLGEMSASDLRFTDGKIKHGPSNMVVATARHEKIGPGIIRHDVSHVDGTPVYSGTSKKAALQAIADHHNTHVVTPAPTPDVTAERARDIAAQVRVFGQHGPVKPKHEQVIRDVVERQAAIIPDVVKNAVRGISIGKIDSRGLASRRPWAGDVNIILHQSLFTARDAASKIAGEMQGGFFAPVSPFEHAVDQVIPHEIGHAVAHNVFHPESVPQDEDFWRKFSTQLGVTSQPARDGDKVTRKAVSAWLSEPSVYRAVAKNASGYATTNASEMLAELWSEFSAHSSPRPLAALYGAHVMSRVAQGASWEPVSFAQKTASGKIVIRAADLVKVGPEGYIHGWICVRPPCGPRYAEAKRESHGGRTVHPEGHVIGRDLKKEPGDAGYKIKYQHPDSAAAEVFGGQYASRQDASKAAVLYHNIITMMHETRGDEGDHDTHHQLVLARNALKDGDHVKAAQHVNNASLTARAANMRRWATHLDELSDAIETAPSPVDVSKLSVPTAPEKLGKLGVTDWRLDLKENPDFVKPQNGFELRAYTASGDFLSLHPYAEMPQIPRYFTSREELDNFIRDNQHAYRYDAYWSFEGKKKPTVKAKVGFYSVRPVEDGKVAGWEAQQKRFPGEITIHGDEHGNLADRVPIHIAARTEPDLERDTERGRQIAADVRKQLQHQSSFVPLVVANTQISVTPDVRPTPKSKTLADYAPQQISEKFSGIMRVSPHILSSVNPRNAEQVLERAQKSGWWVPVDPHWTLGDTVIAHETGHGVASLAWRAAGVPQSALLWARIADAAGVSARPAILTHAGVLRWLHDAKNKAALRNAISEYGISDSHEMMAELWCEYTMSSNPRPVAELYGEYVMDLLRKRGDI